jgi:hypothetical protein
VWRGLQWGSSGGASSEAASSPRREGSVEDLDGAGTGAWRGREQRRAARRGRRRRCRAREGGRAVRRDSSVGAVVGARGQSV